MDDRTFVVALAAGAGGFLFGALFGARTLGALYGRRVAQAAARLAALAVRAEMGGARLAKWRATDLAFAAYLRALRMNPFAIRPRLPARLRPARRAPAEKPAAARGGGRARG